MKMIELRLNDADDDDGRCLDVMVLFGRCADVMVLCGRWTSVGRLEYYIPILPSRKIRP